MVTWFKKLLYFNQSIDPIVQSGIKICKVSQIKKLNIMKLDELKIEKSMNEPKWRWIFDASAGRTALCTYNRI
jgi:hypothetical protein